MLFSLYIVLHALYSMHFIQFIEFYALYSMQFILCIVFYVCRTNFETRCWATDGRKDIVMYRAAIAAKNNNKKN